MVDSCIREFVSFELEGELYALDIRAVKEVNPNCRIAPVPRSPDNIRGLVNIRGQVVLVLDIAVTFGRDARPITRDSQIVILKTSQELKRIRGLSEAVAAERFSDKPIGFLVDRIGDVITVDAARIEDAPPHLAKCNARFVSGVVYMDDRLLIALDPAEML